MRIGISGGAGFIGSYVAEHAIEGGHDVIIFDRRGRLPSTSLDNAETRGRLQVFLGDVRDEVAMDELAAHADGIIHLAACLGTQETITNPIPAAKTNHDGGLNFLLACRDRNRPGVYIGVGNHWMNNTYAISKSTIERYVKMANVEWGTSINVVRAMNAYGPRQSVAPPYGPATVRKITPAFVCRALLGEPIEVYGDGQQVSDMVHVRDVARALVTALEYAAAGAPLHEPVEVGPKQSMSVNQRRPCGTGDGRNALRHSTAVDQTSADAPRRNSGRPSGRQLAHPAQHWHQPRLAHPIWQRDRGDSRMVCRALVSEVPEGSDHRPGAINDTVISAAV